MMVRLSLGRTLEHADDTGKEVLLEDKFEHMWLVRVH